MSNHKLFCVMAESGAGKDTLVNRLCEETGLKKIISYTTRPRRKNEGDTHIFVDDSVYEQMRDKLAAYTEINEAKYWTTLDQLYNNDIYIVDPIGLKTLEDLSLEDIDICSIYINVPLDIRMLRAIERGDDTLVFAKRTADEAKQFIDMKAHGGFDYALSNLNADKAYAVLKSIIDIENNTKLTED